MIGREPRNMVYRQIGAGVLLAVLLAVFGYKASERSTTSDFRRYYMAGESVVAGRSIYENAGQPLEFKYFPIFAQGMSVFARLPIRTAAWVWYGIVAGGYVGMVWLAGTFFARVAPDDHRAWKIALAAGVLGSLRFFIDNARLGQINIPVAFLAVAGAYCVAHGRERTGGVLTAFGAAIKFMPIVLVLYYIWKGRWKATAWAGLTLMACLFLIPALTWGWQGNIDLLRQYISNRSHMVTDLPVEDAPGQSVPALLNRFLRDNVIANTREGPRHVNLLELDRTTVKRFAAVAVALLVMAAAWKTRRRWADMSHAQRGLEIGLILILMLLISPEARRAHFITLVWPFSGVAFLLARAWPARRLEVVLGGGALVCMAMTASDVVGRPLAGWLQAHGVIGVGAMLLAVAVWRLYEDASPQANTGLSRRR